MNLETTDNNALLACSGCKRGFSPDKLGRMARLPLVLGRLVHMTPGNEGEQYYCSRCRSSQNLGMITLVAFGSAATAGHWSPIAAGVIMLAWLACLFVWLLFCLFRELHRRVSGAHLKRAKTL